MDLSIFALAIIFVFSMGTRVTVRGHRVFTGLLPSMALVWRARQHRYRRGVTWWLPFPAAVVSLVSIGAIIVTA